MPITEQGALARLATMFDVRPEVVSRTAAALKSNHLLGSAGRGGQHDRLARHYLDPLELVTLALALSLAPMPLPQIANRVWGYLTLRHPESSATFGDELVDRLVNEEVTDFVVGTSADTLYAQIGLDTFGTRVTAAVRTATVFGPEAVKALVAIITESEG